MEFHYIRRFTDGSQEVSDRTIDLTDATLGCGSKPPVSGKAWEIREIIANTRPLPTIIAELVDDNGAA